ncbi:hypothetical protein D3C75_1008630 [compost metagenome]
MSDTGRHLPHQGQTLHMAQLGADFLFLRHVLNNHYYSVRRFGTLLERGGVDLISIAAALYFGIGALFVVENFLKLGIGLLIHAVPEQHRRRPGKNHLSSEIGIMPVNQLQHEFIKLCYIAPFVH